MGLQYTSEEKRNILLVLILYIIQGITLGLFEAFKVIYAQNGVSKSRLSELGFVYLPFTFKFLTAPLLDTYYSKKFGQRKTYIIPIQYIFSIVLTYLAINITDYIEKERIFDLSLIGFFLVFLTAQQDISLDGWGLKLFSEEKQGVCNTLNIIGQSFGILVSSNFMINLSSTVISIPNYLLCLAVFILVVTLYTHFRVPEKHEVELEASLSLGEVLRCMTQFFKNKNLRIILLYIFSFKINYFIIPSVYSIDLIQKGFSKETLAAQSSIISILSLALTFTILKFNMFKKEIFYLKITIILFFTIGLLEYYALRKFQATELTHDQIYIINYPLFFAESILSNLSSLLMGGFNSRISDSLIGASTYTVFTSVFNFGGQMIQNFSFILVDKIGYPTIIAFNIVFLIIFLLTIQKKMEKLQKVDKIEFSITQDLLNTKISKSQKSI